MRADDFQNATLAKNLCRRKVLLSLIPLLMFTPLLLSLSPVPSGSVSSTVSILNLFLAFLSFTHFSFHHVVFFWGARSQKPSITMPRCCTFIQPSFKVVYSAPAGLKIGLIIQKPLRFFVYQTTAGG